MSRGGWLTIIAALGLILLCGVLYGGYELYKAGQQRDADYRYQPARDARLPVIPPKQEQPQAYQPNCQNPQSQADADLCAQWAAVHQITETNRLASLTLAVGVFGLFALVRGCCCGRSVKPGRRPGGN